MESLEEFFTPAERLQEAEREATEILPPLSAVRRKTYLVRAAIISVLLHGTVFLGDLIRTYKMSDTREPESSIAAGDINYREQLEEFIDILEENFRIPILIPTIDFFLEAEKTVSRKDPLKIEEARNIYRMRTEKLKALKNEGKSFLEVAAAAAAQYQSGHQDGKSTVTDILTGGGGNCEARAKVEIATLCELFPEKCRAGEIRLQIFGDHIRTVIQDQGEIYAIEGGVPQKLTEEDLSGTRMESTDVFHKALVKKLTKKDFLTGEIVIGEFPHVDPYLAKTDTFFDFGKAPRNYGGTRSVASNEETERVTIDISKETVKPAVAEAKLFFEPETIEEIELQKIIEEWIIEAQKSRKLNIKFLEGKQDLIKDWSFLKDPRLQNVISVALYLSTFQNLNMLRGMALESLTFAYTNVTSLEPLRGMPLEWLDLHSTNVTNLEPLRGMPLEQLDFDGTAVTSLEPLRGMPLERLDLHSTNVTSLEPLRGMPLEWLDFAHTNVTSLEPLRGMPLEWLDFAHTNVTNLEPLRGMPLEQLDFAHTNVTNLEPLRGMPLEKLSLEGTNVHDFSPLCSTPLRDKFPCK